MKNEFARAVCLVTPILAIFAFQLLTVFVWRFEKGHSDFIDILSRE